MPPLACGNGVVVMPPLACGNGVVVMPPLACGNGVVVMPPLACGNGVVVMPPLVLWKWSCCYAPISVEMELLYHYYSGFGSENCYFL